MKYTVEQIIERARRGEAIDKVLTDIPRTEVRRVYEALPEECKEGYADISSIQCALYGPDIRMMLNTDWDFEPTITYDYEKKHFVEVKQKAADVHPMDAVMRLPVSAMEYFEVARRNVWTGELSICILLKQLIEEGKITNLQAEPIVDSIKFALRKSIYPLNSAWQALADKVRSSSHLDKVIASILEVVASTLRVFPYTEERVFLRQQLMYLYLDGLLSEQEVAFCTLLHEAQCFRAAFRTEALPFIDESDFLSKCVEIEEKTDNLCQLLLAALINSNALIALIPCEIRGLYSWVDSEIKPHARKSLLLSSFPDAFP